jgi:glycosyltransferase involved in cell wall biosynthesis
MVLQVRAYEEAKPNDIELVKCRPDKRPPDDIDAFILHGDLYPRQWIGVFDGKPLMAHRHGGWFSGDPVFRRWVLDNASLVTFNSPKQRELFRYPVRSRWAYVPTPVDIDRFQKAARNNGHTREGMVYLGLLAPVKGIPHTVDWAMCYNHPIDFYGGALYPTMAKAIVPPCVWKGSVPYEKVPELLSKYKEFVFMPYDGDLYSRTVIEAWAAGCELILSGDRAAFDMWFDPEQCKRGGEIFWERFQEVVDG